MRPRRAITQQDATGMFDRAVHEHALAVLTFQRGDDWLSFKSRFMERDPKCRFVVLDHQPNRGEDPPHLAVGQCIGISFRNQSRKILFASVVEAKGHYLLHDRTSVPAIRYRWPDSLTELQRRSYYRTPVPDSVSLIATLWPGGPAARTAAQGSALQVTSGTLINVSCGGAMVRLNELSAPTWTEGQTLGVELQLGDGRPPLVVSASFRGSRNDELGQPGVAIQFVGLELSVDGRLILQRLASVVQRYNRMSISSGLRHWERPQE